MTATRGWARRACSRVSASRATTTTFESAAPPRAVACADPVVQEGRELARGEGDEQERARGSAGPAAGGGGAAAGGAERGVGGVRVRAGARWARARAPASTPPSAGFAPRGSSERALAKRRGEPSAGRGAGGASRWTRSRRRPTPRRRRAPRTVAAHAPRRASATSARARRAPDRLRARAMRTDDRDRESSVEADGRDAHARHARSDGPGRGPRAPRVVHRSRSAATTWFL